jgi:2'-hydroxyisoflavone reductase
MTETSTSRIPAGQARSILILGGTSWLGGRVAALAVERGHAVTCLARGQAGTAPEGVEFRSADRRADDAYDAVADRDWDSVLDVSWQPELVRGATSALGDRTAHWVYVSSCSVYSDDGTPGADESAALHEAWSGAGEASIEDYGPAKVACERAVLDAAGAGGSLVVRPGLIGGYGDRSYRFGYWPARFSRVRFRDDVVLTPDLEPAAQILDVDDLAQWLLRSVEERTTGVYNAVGDSFRLGDLLAVCAGAAGAEPTLVSADDVWLTDHGVQPWSGEESLPLWLPQSEYAGFMRRSNAAAKRAGLTLRPLGETASAALRWEVEQGVDRQRRAGLVPDTERRLLDERVQHR